MFGCERMAMYANIAVYTDDLAIASRDPKKITDALEGQHGFKLKGTGPIQYHLGCDYSRDPDGTLVCGPRRYIEKMIGAYELMFGEQPRGYSSPLEKNDHPELDDSKELKDEDVTKYQSMIGALQWAISLGTFDVLMAVMTMSRFRANPRAGCLDRLKRIYVFSGNTSTVPSVSAQDYQTTQILLLASTTGCILSTATCRNRFPRISPNHLATRLSPLPK